MSISKCRGCGRQIVWGVDPQSGRSIPLDPRAPVYELRKIGTRYEATRANYDAEKNAGAMVSHFATCPKASEFSSSKKKPVAGS